MKGFFQRILLSAIISMLCLLSACAQSSEANAAHEDRCEFLISLGWAIGEQMLEQAEAEIPTEFDDVYSEYNKLQKEQGYDLEIYKGKKATRYTYEILNHPRAQGRQVRANLLVFDDRIIGGDIMVTAIDGFMHGLCPYPGE